MARRLIHWPGVAGADEAGRGPLAGPVLAACAALPEGFDVEGIDDSKRLDPKRREDAAMRVRSEALWIVEVADVDEVDRLNILHASLAAMGRAIARLAPARVLVDGDRLPPGLACAAECVVGGDAIHACVAAASILAKVERDRIMRELGRVYPEYGFERHFGYATPEHLDALRRHGPCPIHRRSFAPVRDWEVQPSLVYEA